MSRASLCRLPASSPKLRRILNLVLRLSIHIGHVEAKDVGVALDVLVADSEREKPKTDNGRQLRRYCAALPNLLYTDGLEWHWFVGGEPRLAEPLRVATWDKAKKKLVVGPQAQVELADLLQKFRRSSLQRSGDPMTWRDDWHRWLAGFTMSLLRYS